MLFRFDGAIKIHIYLDFKSFLKYYLRNLTNKAKTMNVNERIRIVVQSGIKMKTIADKAGVSYYRVSSVVNPDKYKGESKFDKYEAKRINDAIDDILVSIRKAAI